MRDRRQHVRLMEALMATSEPQARWARPGPEQRPQRRPRLCATGIKPHVAAGNGVSALTDVQIAPVIDWINDRCANPGGT
jgi:hypothetical protein